MKKINIDNLEVSKISQCIYNNFNNFILSEDRRLFNKLISRALLYHEVRDIPGDIVECGVFKGTGIYTFLKLKNLYNPNSLKKVIGFDFFDTKELINSISANFLFIFDLINKFRSLYVAICEEPDL